ncbi:hypothetical protein LguiB_007995 [Lonicera macranthoides]
MVGRVESCAECTQNCVLIHANRKDPSPIVTSFFKVMYPDEYSKVLLLPPKFARTVSSLVGQTIHLEDSSGQRWIVTISNVDGSLAFQNGWHEFSLAHGLNEGDFLVFNYIMGSHFVVQIYDNSGCQKLVFFEENGTPKKRWINGNLSPPDGGTRKKRKTSGNFSGKGGSPQKVGNGLIDEQASSSHFQVVSDIEISQSQPMVTDNISNFNNGVNNATVPPKYVEEPFIIHRDGGYIQEDYRSSLFDLADFEMNRNSRPDGDRTNKFSVEDEGNLHPANPMLQCITDFEMNKSRSDGDGTNKFLVEDDCIANSMLQSLTGFEMNRSRSDGDGTNKFSVEDERNHHPSNSRPQSLTEAGVVVQDPVVADLVNVESPAKRDHFTRKDKNSMLMDKLELSAEKDFNNGKSSRHLVDTSVIKLANSVDMSKIIRCQSPEGRSNAHASGMAKVAKKELGEKSELHCFGLHGKLPNTVSECDNSSRLPVENDDNVLKVVKTEPVTSFDFCPPYAANISCVVERGNQAFFELPKCLPSISFRRKSSERKTVFLRDPVRRLWAVLYLEKHGLKVLTSGWKAFDKANSIQSGDECVFGLESEPDSIYTVTIVRK